MSQVSMIQRRARHDWGQRHTYQGRVSSSRACRHCYLFIGTVYIKGQKISSVYEVGLVHRKLVQSRAGDMSASTLFRIQTGSPRES